MAKKSPGLMGPSAADQRRWQAEDDLRTLQRAEEIRGDKSRVTAAQRMAREQMKALSKVGAKAPRGER